MGYTESEHRPTAAVPRKIHREVRFGAYVLGSTLGEGEFGKVKLGWRKDGQQPSQVAIKLIKRENIVKNSEAEIKIHREINSLKLLSHPNIVKLVEVMKSGKYIGIVLEYASGGELFDYILSHKCLKEDLAKKLFAQMVSGIDYMHSKGLVHRDLKLENILLDKHKNVIVSDFGFVNAFNRDKNDLMKTSCGSPCYAAPELVLTQSPYQGTKVDVWSLGVIMYAMLAGYLPFDDDPENEDGTDIVRLYHYICKTPLTFPEFVSPLARDLLRRIIVPDPRKRISLRDIKSHPWLAQYAGLLSITHQELDQSYQSKPSEQAYKRYSMGVERTSSASLVMNRNGRSYSTQNVSGRLYSNPSAPTTSASVANAIVIPPSPSLNSINSGLSASTPNNAGGSPTSSLERDRPSTASMYSSASIALKAVVDHENNLGVVAGSTQRMPSPPIPRSTTHTGSIAKIVERHRRSPSSDDTRRSSPTAPPQTAGSQISQTSSKLPASGKKPRPTSYHPSSSTHDHSLAIDYLKSLPPLSNQFKAREVSPSAIPEGFETPERVPRTTPSKPSEVLDEAKPNDIIVADETRGDAFLDESKRNSLMHFIEEKMDSLEVNKEINVNLQPGVSLTGYKSRSTPEPPSDDTTMVVSGENTLLESDAQLDDVFRRGGSRPASSKIQSQKSTAATDRGVEEAKPDAPKEAKKKNRFSLLSFYSSSPPATTPERRASRKVLEPSSDVNVMNSDSEKLSPQSAPNVSPAKKRIPSASSAPSRASISSARIASGESTASTKDASAARKVMDFFKRRSMRA